MRRVVALVAALVVVPATSALGVELDELLERGREASFSAEQVIRCSTPDGVKEALVRIEQAGGEVRLSSNVTDDVEVTAGSGGWTLTRDDGLIAEATVVQGDSRAEPLYDVDEEGSVEYLDRIAIEYLLVRDGEPRAELVIDEETGVVVETLTFTDDEEVYCERRLISFDSRPPEAAKERASQETTVPTDVDQSNMPETLLGFELLDHYEDEDGIRFSYYSDGFFSFALFETPSEVAVPEGTPIELQSGDYLRVFTAGQVTYVWETRDSGMALVGDLPPDLHETVLAEMPHPQDPGLFRRWWRALFG